MWLIHIIVVIDIYYCCHCTKYFFWQHGWCKVCKSVLIVTVRKSRHFLANLHPFPSCYSSLFLLKDKFILLHLFNWIQTLHFILNHSMNLFLTQSFSKHTFSFTTASPANFHRFSVEILQLAHFQNFDEIALMHPISNCNKTTGHFFHANWGLIIHAFIFFLSCSPPLHFKTKLEATNLVRIEALQLRGMSW